MNDEIAAQNANNASMQASIAEKQKFADLQAKAQEKQQLLAAAYRRRGVVLGAADGLLAG